MIVLIEKEDNLMNDLKDCEVFEEVLKIAKHKMLLEYIENVIILSNGQILVKESSADERFRLKRILELSTIEYKKNLGN